MKHNGKVLSFNISQGTACKKIIISHCREEGVYL
jgi:hypothetical protein